MEEEKIIWTNGCFDILHRGHLELLKYCKSLGLVIVGLNSDGSVKRLKGPERPINNQDDRKFIDLVKDFEKDKAISIDESKKNQEEIQKSTDNSILEIENLAKQKENEILKV